MIEIRFQDNGPRELNVLDGISGWCWEIAAISKVLYPSEIKKLKLCGKQWNVEIPYLQFLYHNMDPYSIRHCSEQNWLNKSSVELNPSVTKWCREQGKINLQELTAFSLACVWPPVAPEIPWCACIPAWKNFVNLCKQKKKKVINITFCRSPLHLV